MIERLTAALADRYRILRELGEGGMATVYLADDLKHERKVAIKVLRPELAAVVGADRFLSEIRTTANLQHPHILPLFDSGEADSFLYYVMPHMAGETLGERIEREKQLPVDDAVAIASKVASALAYAHRSGVIHRDIKPANILLEDGEPQVADFGIALAVQEAGGGRMTETGLSLGTPFYMSPEQATGDRDPDPRSDLYSLGCVTYEMLTGEPPFSGNTAQSVLAKILTDDAPLVTRVRKTVPLHVASAVARATQRLPADRFADIAEFISALNDPGYRWGTLAAGDEGASLAKASGASLPWKLATAALAVAVVALGAIVGTSAGDRASGEPLAVRVNMPDSQRILNPLDYLSAILSDDGSTLVYTGPDYPTGEQLWAKRRGDPDGVPIRGTRSPLTYVVAPDGSEVGFLERAGGELKVVSTSGGTPRVLADSVQLVGADWGGDGYIYFQNSQSGISRVPGIGGPVELVSKPEREITGDLTWPDLLPGGEKLLVTVWGSSASSDSIAILDIETGDLKLIASGVRAQFMAPDRLLISRFDQSIEMATFDPDKGELLTQPRSVINEVRRLQSGALDFTIGSSGALLYVSGGGARGYPAWVDRTGEVTRVQEDWLAEFVGPSVSPDGSGIALAVVDGAATDIWTRSTAAGDIPPQRLSFQETDITRPTWSTGSDTVIYVGQQEGASSTQILARRADGTGDAVVLMRPEQAGFDDALSEVELSPDGRWMVLRVGGGSSTRDLSLFERGVDSIARPLFAEVFNEHSPMISPDGRFIVYVSNESGTEQVYVRTFPEIAGGKWLVSSGAGLEPVWGPDNRTIFYRDIDRMMVEAQWNPGVGVTGRQTLFDTSLFLADPVHPAYDIHPDGRFLMIELADNPEIGLVWIENFRGLIDNRGEGR